MNQKIKNSIDIYLKVGKKGAYAGVAISILYMLANYGIDLNIHALLYHFFCGAFIGFSIAVVTGLVDDIVLSLPIKWSWKVSLLQMGVTFILSAAVFGGSICLFSWLVLRYIPNLDVLLKSSSWTGMASVFVALLFKYIDEKEEKYRIEKQNRELAVVEERKRIAREIHDSISQKLFGISLNLNTTEYMLEHDISKARELIFNLKNMIQEAQTEMRLMIYELRPLELSDRGFQEAIDNLVEIYNVRFGLRVICQYRGITDNIDNSVQLVLYRVLQEALNNIVRHAEATQANIDIEVKNEKITMDIIDDGIGFSNENLEKAGHYGINGMLERIKSINGKIEINSSEGKGTKLHVEI